VTLLRALIGANVVFVTLAMLLIATDWREGSTSTRHTDLKIVGPVKLYTLPLPSTFYEQQQLLTTTYALAPRVRVTPVTRSKPPIAGPDLMTGKRVTLSQFRGKPVFVCVWASWNVGSLDQASTVARFARSHEDEVAFLGIDSEDPKPAARAFSRRFHMDFPSIWDPVGILAAGWSPVTTTLVFDRSHVLVQRIDGSAPLAQLNAALRRVTRR
jgi:thiol-disulfide isomerase/thioredoxin